MKEIASLWIGEALGDIELASIASFRRFGHPVKVYSYAPIRNLPEGVTAGDAAKILPCERILTHKRHASPAIHADIFRYALLRHTESIWADLDMIALRPFVFDTPWVFGFETPDELNNAVLRLPQDSEMLARLCELHLDSRGIPPHLTGFRRFKYLLRGLPNGGVPVASWPWGATGPRALTHFARQSGEIVHALPVTAFYAIPQAEAARFVRPGDITYASLPPGAFGVHLWGRDLRRVIETDFRGEIPKDSFLGYLLGELT